MYDREEREAALERRVDKMKEKLYTIELMDAIKSGDECPFCYIERKIEQNTLSFVLGSSYMESDVREQTDRMGVCKNHSKMMFQYGNQLGNAWILKTRFHRINQEMQKQIAQYQAPKTGFFSREKKKKEGASSLTDWMKHQKSSCYVCARLSETYERVLHTFLYLIEKDQDFLEVLKESKGFCFSHFSDLLEICEGKLGEKEKARVLPLLFDLMKKNMDRVQEDIDWFIEKQDYLNAKADWKESRDGVQRAMQKLVGGYPADPPFKKE